MGEVFRARVFTVDLATGERKHWRETGPGERSGVASVAPVRMSADANHCACSCLRALTDPFEVRGLS